MTMIHLMLKKVKNVLPNEMLVKRHKSLDKFTQTLSFIISQANHTLLLFCSTHNFYEWKRVKFLFSSCWCTKTLTLYTCFCTQRSQLSNCLQKPWRECIAQLSFGSAVAAGEARKQDAKIRTGAQEGTSKGCFLEAVRKVRICECQYKL